MRKKIVAGNWKMNLDLNEGYALAEEVRKIVTGIDSLNAEVILCPPFIHLKGVSDIIKGTAVKSGAQNCSTEISGAFTGEVSAPMIKSTGAEWVIIGHSERRTMFGETDIILLKKTETALKAGLKVIFCCGEILPEREKGIHFDTVQRQLQEGMFKLPVEKFRETVIAYEPVWAIGTGVTASPDQAQEMHSFIRKEIEKVYGEAVSESTVILYGGSCKGSNAAELFANPDVDGGLIGGASLKAAEFSEIIKAASCQ
jgi:triosephosphate isomerase